MTAKRVNSQTARNIATKTDILNCGICLGRLRKPKFLNCPHSFCEECLKGCTPADVRRVVCPKCDTETPFPEDGTGVSSISTNLDLVDILHEYEQQMKLLCNVDPSTKCDACVRGNRANACCLVCQEYLCCDCEKAHRKLHPQRAHNVELLDWVPNLDIKPKTPDCNTHPGRPAIFACACCNKRICVQCVGIEYPKAKEIESCRRCHRQIQDSHEKHVNHKLAIAHNPKDDDDKEEEMVQPDLIQSAVTESDMRKIARCDVNLMTLREEILKATQEEIARVGDEHKDLLKEIRALEYRELLTIRRFRDKQRTGALKCTQINSIARNLIANDWPYLTVTVATRLQPILKKCCAIDGNLFPDDLELVTFMTDEISLMEPSKVIGRAECLMTFKTQWGRDGKAGKVSYDWGHGIATYPCGDVVVCDRQAKRVIIYNREGEVQFEVTSPPERSQYSLNEPVDVAITSDSFLLLVDLSNFVKIFDDKGMFLRSFMTQNANENPNPKVILWGVAIDNKDRIAVADGGRRLVTLHHSDGALIRRIPTKCNPGFLAINSRYQILVSAYPIGKVEAFDYEGNLLFWFNCMIEGRRLMIAGLTVDTQDNIWIGVYDLYEPEQDDKAGSVHVYTPDGLYLGCVARQLHKPVGIALTREGDLAVVDYTRVRIFV